MEWDSPSQSSTDEHYRRIFPSDCSCSSRASQVLRITPVSRERVISIIYANDQHWSIPTTTGRVRELGAPLQEEIYFYFIYILYFSIIFFSWYSENENHFDPSADESWEIVNEGFKRFVLLNKWIVLSSFTHPHVVTKPFNFIFFCGTREDRHLAELEIVIDLIYEKNATKVIGNWGGQCILFNFCLIKNILGISDRNITCSWTNTHVLWSQTWKTVDRFH